ncbi:MAG: hypothetical protein J7K72_01205 [Candidatus Aenigmarchaeota archaeon]|nr:hypothetical protein [Candidatus Aenigmarchaeota archaeon]
MEKKKGQLFLVSIIFLIGTILFIQHALFQYSEIDLSEPFKNQDMNLMETTINLINKTIKNTYFCNETKNNFQEKLEYLRHTLSKEQGKGVYSIDIIYDLNCTNWDNVYPHDAPLKITISVIGFGKEAKGTFNIYHRI